MNQISVTNSCEPISEEDVLNVERILGIKLPYDYRLFILEHNGGRIIPSVFPIIDCPQSEFGILTWLLCVKGDDDLVLYAREYYNRVPSDLLVVGYDPGGNLICISVNGDNYGSVYFWEHEFESEDDEIPSYDNVHLVADSFTAFLDVLDTESNKVRQN